MSEHILITRGASFVGSHLADHLLELGYRIRVLDSLSPQVHAELAECLEGQRAHDRVAEARAELEARGLTA